MTRLARPSHSPGIHKVGIEESEKVRNASHLFQLGKGSENAGI
jgi:hypothetical protein